MASAYRAFAAEFGIAHRPTSPSQRYDKQGRWFDGVPGR